MERNRALGPDLVGEAMAQRQYALRCAWRVCQDEETAQDAVQEAMIKAWSKIDMFTGKTLFELRAWVGTIARRETLRVLSNGGRKILPITPADDLSIYPDDLSPPLDYVRLTNEILERVCRLPEPGRTVINMMCYWGSTGAEVCEALSIPESTVHVIAHRARQRLKDEVLV